jgi:hypothetical protein
MQRREFITGLSGVVAWSVAARAQAAAAPMIGFLHPGPRDTPGSAFIFAAVRHGLAEMGYIEGRNLTIEYRWAQDHMERLPELAADLARLPVAAGSNFAENYRLIGGYVGRILMGDKAADLPVIQPTRFELVINTIIAKSLGLQISELLLGTADDVIQ